MEMAGTPHNTFTAVCYLYTQMFRLWFSQLRNEKEALAKAETAFDFVDDASDKRELWSPDHATLLGLSARIKNMCGQVDAAYTDAKAAFSIYERLGGVEFRHEGSAGCDHCGELMLHLGVLKYKLGDEKGSLEAYQTGTRISTELGCLEGNIYRLGLD